MHFIDNKKENIAMTIRKKIQQLNQTLEVKAQILKY